MKDLSVFLMLKNTLNTLKKKTKHKTKEKELNCIKFDKNVHSEENSTYSLFYG